MLTPQLQKLDLRVTAELHIYKSMLKSKLIISASAFPSYILEKVKASAVPQDVAHVNVHARLFKSNAVVSSMADIMNDIRATLGIESEISGGKKKRLRAVDYAAEDNPTKQITVKNNEPQETFIKESESHIESIVKPLQEEYGVHGSDDKTLDLDFYKARLAVSSDDESFQGVNSEGSWAASQVLSHVTPNSQSPSPPSSSSIPSASASSRPHKTPSTTPKSTTFLPSLTMGYISDSNSEISNLSSTASNGGPKLRKNRRGQQERRQIWEKKYGQNANHLKNHTDPLSSRHRDRDRGWDARKGASTPENQGRRGRGRGRGRDVRTGSSRSVGRGGPTSSGANSDPVQAITKANRVEGGIKGKQTTEAALHPSWEAAKKAKEKRTGVSFQGKKVVF